MRIEIHILQNFAPSNLNRDDTGSPKEAEFGGYRRARISSQCIKRSVRRYFQDQELFPAEHLAIRTKRLLEAARERLTKANREPAAIDRAVGAALAAGGLKLGDRNLTQYLLFLGQTEIDRFIEVVDKHFDALATEPEKAEEAAGGTKKKSAKKVKAEARDATPEEVQRAVPALLDGGKAADLALFGRMLADLKQKSVDAACQVAHALSTNKIHSMEMDYYTAVDDINNDSTGADMIGTVEFNSACFYRYANLDLGQLHTNLQKDSDLARKTVEAFLQAFILAVPTGKQNSFAAHNPPSLIFAVVREGVPVSLANAFVQPITPRGSDNLVTLSIQALDNYYGRLVKMYGNGGVRASAVCQMEAVPTPNLKDVVSSAKELIAQVTEAGFAAGVTA